MGLMLGLNLSQTFLYRYFVGFCLSPPQQVTVAVYGGPGTGKKSLISVLNNRVYRCPQDGRLLVLDVQLGSELSQASVALILLDAQATWMFSPDIVDVARRVAASACVLHTKVDLIPSDYSDPHLWYLRSTPSLAHRYDIECLPVNLMTGQGVDGVLSFIGQSVTGSSAAPRSPHVVFPFRRLWSYVLDCIAACFALSQPGALPDISAELEPLTSDSVVEQLMDQPADAAWGEELKRRLGAENARFVPVNHISPSLIVKRPRGSERASMEFVRRNTTIPIPRDLCPKLSYLVMDFVDGEMLYECWDKLSRFKQFRVACTLRRYVKQLRSLTRPAPGALDDSCVYGIIFDEFNYGPFASVRSFRQFCEKVAFEGWIIDVRGGDRVEVQPAPRADLDWTPVFTHGDLNMSNIMLDRQGSLWIIDWMTAGFYPRSMEATVMQRVDEFFHKKDVPLSWRHYRSFITGRTSREELLFWDSFTVGTRRFPGN